MTGKTCVVTGVGSGIGAEIARRLAREGGEVIGCDLNDEAGAAVMDGLGRYEHADVRKEEAVQALVATAVRETGRLDVMVNNAAIEIEEELVSTTEEQLDAILAVNLKGVFFGCKHAVLAMRKGGGAIVNIASVLSIVGDGVLAAYCAAKGGVVGITKATAVQYARDQIRCNAICPGDVDTPLVQSYFAASPDPAARRREVEDHYPAGRIAQPHEVAAAVLYLASDDAAYVNGHLLVVDGGLLAKVYR